MKKLLLISIILLYGLDACKTPEKTVTMVKALKPIYIDYCAIEDSIIATGYWQKYYHEQVRPKTKIIMSPISYHLPRRDSLINEWKKQGYRVVQMGMRRDAYVTDSCKIVGGKVQDIANQKFDKLFRDSIVQSSGKTMNDSVFKLTLRQRKINIRCK